MNFVHDYEDVNKGYTDEELGSLVEKYQIEYPVTGKELTNIGSVLTSRNVPGEEQIALKMGIAVRSLWDRTGFDCLDTSMNIVAAQILLSVHRLCCVSRPDQHQKKRAGVAQVVGRPGTVHPRRCFACVLHHCKLIRTASFTDAFAD